MKGNLGSFSPQGNKVVVMNHPPILETKTMTAGADTYPEGELMALDAAGGLVRYDPAAVDPDPSNTVVGVLIEESDSAAEDADGIILVHGTVKADELTVLGEAADADAIAALKAIGIFAV